MAGGRPTIYNEDFCEMLIGHMAKGYSFESFASVTDTCKDTLYEWVKVHPEFSDAKKRALEKSRFWWESQGIEGIYTKETFEQDENGSRSTKKALNSSVWIFNMKNRFKDEWRDKQETEHSGSILSVIRPKSLDEIEAENNS
jgi:hypothetical protein